MRHGRSVQVMCALLVSLGVVDNWKNAEKLIKEKRPYIRMNDLHRKALEDGQRTDCSNGFYYPQFIAVKVLWPDDKSTTYHGTNLVIDSLSLLVSLASHPSINLPTILGKNRDGSFPIWSLIIFSPYLYFVRWVAALKRLKRREVPYTEVYAGLYVGGWPFSPERLPPGNPAVIDCTCEFPRVIDISENDYLCIPTWDTRPPDPSDIEFAVK
ncbi:dual specificity protein phosphatase domain-containing protein [Artemisia annua]|uniref:Dual specificity protein phosphatase domain-containing protein n=1 Tax=Artemisia annua TaxID=35608 RepID=A0A2U1MI76_ARTAN|nr:dual specificity protein phosphatase domain-containing protein [Artemisia annua]